MEYNEKNVAAILETAGSKLKVTARPIPTPGPNEVVVRNHAISVNHVDWIIQEVGLAGMEYPNILGSDSCGVITAVGSDVENFKPGDRVMGYSGLLSKNDSNHGAWQTYTLLRDIITTKIPASMTFEEGSVLPMSMTAAAVTLFKCLNIPTLAETASPQASGFLLWDAASPLGTSTLQLAKSLGFKVFAVSRNDHHESLKALGAFKVFDYREKFLKERIANSAKTAGVPLRLGFNTFGEKRSIEDAAAILAASGGKGSKLAIVPLPNEPSACNVPQEVEIISTAPTGMVMEDEEFAHWFFNKYLPKCLANGTVISAPGFEIIEGGLAAAQKALDLSKVRFFCKKLVVKVDCDRIASN